MNYKQTLDYLFSRLPMYQRKAPSTKQNYRTTCKGRKAEQQQLYAIATFNKVLQQARKKTTKGKRRRGANTTTNQTGKGIFSVLIPLLATVIGSAIGG